MKNFAFVAKKVGLSCSFSLLFLNFADKNDINRYYVVSF